jgi:antitoxin component YwqK of YwqJK toxin-antitoxin module
MYYNQNVTAQHSFGVGYDLTGGLDEAYVNSILVNDLLFYHSIPAIHLRTLSELDMRLAPNSKYDNFYFNDTFKLSFADLLIYLGNKYAYFSVYRDFNISLFTDSSKKVIEQYDLGNCKRFIIDEWHFYNAGSNTWYTLLKSIGFVPENQKDGNAVLWLAFDQIDIKSFARVKFSKVEGFGDFSALMSARPFVSVPLEIGTSSLFHPSPNNLHIDLLDAPRCVFLINRLLELEQEGVLPKGKLKKGKYKSRHLQGKFVDGKPHGLWKLSGLRDGMAEIYFENGKAHGAYLLKKNPSGKKFETGQFVENIREGKMQQFYGNGSLSGEFLFNKGILEKQVRLYHENGKVKAEGFYLNGICNGKYTTFYENGLRREMGDFKDGKVFGVWDYNIKLPAQACGYLNDNEQYGVAHESAQPGAYKDCVATYSIEFEHVREKGCVEGICVIPRYRGEVK